MSRAKDILVNKQIFIIEDPKRGKFNPYVGYLVRVKWKRPWGKKPAGFTAQGVLTWTFCKYGRTLIGEIITESGKIVSCPWSRNYLEIGVIGPAEGDLLRWAANRRMRVNLPVPTWIAAALDS